MKYNTVHEFFQDYTTRVNNLIIYTEESNPNMTEVLKGMQENFLYTVGNCNSAVKKEMKIIDKRFKKLTALIQKCSEPEENTSPNFFQKLFKTKSPYAKAKLLIKDIRVHINNIKIAK